MDALVARRNVAMADIALAEINLEHTVVRAPCDGIVTSLRTSKGAFAAAGRPVFTLINTEQWFVFANFRETELQAITQGRPAKVYLLADNAKHFSATVESVGFGVLPDDGGLVLEGLPMVKRSINWVRVAQPYAAAYSASKFGLRGLTEALRGELTEYPNIHVCDIYPAVMDTPGFRDGGNYTGHALTPPGPIYDPEMVAKAMVACAISPRAHTTVGAAARLAHLASYLIPGLPLLSGRLTRWGINRSPIAEASSGNLFEPPSGRRGINGGWRKPKDKTPLLIGAAALGILVGFTFTHSRRRDR